MALSPQNFDYVRDLVFSQSAIVLERGKEYLVESRLAPLAQKQGLDSIDAFIAKMRADATNGFHRMVVEAMTTNETLFFRDLHPFDTLKRFVIPELLTRRAAERSLRIWCGACSTGQEPYSIALLIRDAFPQLSTWRIHLLATDINREVLQKAAQGIYSQFEMNRGLPATMLVKYFSKISADQWRLRDDVRSMIEFQEMNLAKNFPITPGIDLVFLRNVMIYFDLETKKAILSRIRSVMAPHAFLFLGGAESVLNIDDRFESVNQGKTVYYRLKN